VGDGEVEQAGEARIEVIAAEPVEAPGSLVPLTDHACLAQNWACAPVSGQGPPGTGASVGLRAVVRMEISSNHVRWLDWWFMPPSNRKEHTKWLKAPII
jgi:hypothetical protein